MRDLDALSRILAKRLGVRSFDIEGYSNIIALVEQVSEELMDPELHFLQGTGLFTCGQQVGGGAGNPLLFLHNPPVAKGGVIAVVSHIEISNEYATAQRFRVLINRENFPAMGGNTPQKGEYRDARGGDRKSACDTRTSNDAATTLAAATKITRLTFGMIPAGSTYVWQGPVILVPGSQLAVTVEGGAGVGMFANFHYRERDYAKAESEFRL